jgi:hypothetical protein
MTNQWDAKTYDAKHAFVYEKAKGLVDLLAPKVGERILDWGSQTQDESRRRRDRERAEHRPNRDSGGDRPHSPCCQVSVRHPHE